MEACQRPESHGNHVQATAKQARRGRRQEMVQSRQDLEGMDCGTYIKKGFSMAKVRYSSKPSQVEIQILELDPWAATR